MVTMTSGITDSSTLLAVRIGAFVLMLAANVLLPQLTGRSIGEQGSDRLLLTPANYTFSIWGVIYSTMAYTLVTNTEWSPTDTALLVGSCVCNVAWLVTWTAQLPLVSAAVLTCLTAVLWALVLRRGDLWAVPLYATWALLATALNVGIAAKGKGWLGEPAASLVTATLWLLGTLAIAGGAARGLINPLAATLAGGVVCWALWGTADSLRDADAEGKGHLWPPLAVTAALAVTTVARATMG